MEVKLKNAQRRSLKAFQPQFRSFMVYKATSWLAAVLTPICTSRGIGIHILSIWIIFFQHLINSFHWYSFTSIHRTRKYQLNEKALVIMHYLQRIQQYKISVKNWALGEILIWMHIWVIKISSQPFFSLIFA